MSIRERLLSIKESEFRNDERVKEYSTHTQDTTVTPDSVFQVISVTECVHGMRYKSSFITAKDMVRAVERAAAELDSAKINGTICDYVITQATIIS